MAKSGGGDRHLQASAAGVVIIRFFLGAFFLYCGIDQLTHVAGFVQYFAKLPASHAISALPGAGAYYAGFFHGALKPGMAVCTAWTIIALELFTGVLLLFGFLTRLAVAIPLLANLVFVYLTFSVLRTDAYVHGLWINTGFFLMELAVLVAAAGRTWGVDALLAPRAKLKILW